jgi:uncharacterized membrane protein
MSAIKSFQQPEYLHVLINPLPVYVLATGLLALIVALLRRNRQTQLLALWLIFLSAASAWPAYLSGQKAYHQVYLIADSDGQSWLDAHMHRAERWIYIFYALAGVAASAALVPAKAPKTALSLAILTVAVAVASLAVGGWIAKAGGQVRHPEFRTKPAAQTTQESTAP